LRQQGELLFQKTRKALYGEVLEAAVPSVSDLRYSFYLCIANKPTRHKLLTITCDIASDYPVTCENHLDGTTTRADSESDFEDYFRSVFESPATQDVLGRLLTYAAH